jgi:hypothetical protein
MLIEMKSLVKYKLETLLVTVFPDAGAVHDDREEFWYVRNPAGNRVPFYSFCKNNL